MNFVLDASVTLAWCFEDEGGDYALRVLDALRSSEAVAASVWPLEVANGLAMAERRGRLDPAATARFMELALRLGVPLATLDERLREAARAEGVRLFAG